MVVAPCATNEKERLEALQRYGILDTAAEPDFDAITTLLSAICETPIALVSLVDSDRQWFKSKVGLAAGETHRDLAFCAHAILQDEVMVVPDATRDPRFADNPLVLEDPRIRFYAGAPLITPDNFAIGTLCAIDVKPRELTPNQRMALKTLSRHVVDLLELRLRLQQTRDLNQALEQANAQRTRFFANMNHEMRTPLSAILGFSRRLQKRIEKDAVPAYVHEGVNIILDSAQRLADMVDDVLDISKIDAGKMTLQLQPFDPVTLLRGVVNTVSVVAEERGVNLQLQVSDRMPTSVTGDAKKIGQIVLNLLSNAVKFTPPGKQVGLDCEYRDQRLMLGVTDEGMGIAPQDVERIFLPFEQISADIPEDTKGTGLGLAIVKSLVDLMGGSVDVTSQPGHGTRFTVVLPLPIA